MNKEQVIKMRTALKGGKNLPLLINLDNGTSPIYEANATQFVLWDDDNEIIYSFRLVDMQSDPYITNKTKCVSVFAACYDVIQTMELVTVPLADLDNVFGSIEESGKTISEDLKKLIKHTYTAILDNNLVDLTRKDINKLVGSVLDTSDDYYNGKFNNTRRQK